MSPASLHARLPRIASGAARLRTMLLAALDGLELAGAPLAARGDAGPPEGGWIVFESQPGRVLLRLGTADPLGAGVALGAAEPLVAAIERALGLELMPVAQVARPAPDAVTIALTHAGARAWIAVAPGVALAPPPRATPLSRLPAGLRVPVEVRIAAPALSAADLCALAAGDLLLCPASAALTLIASTRTFDARLTAPPLPPLQLRARIGAASSTLLEARMTLDPHSSDPHDDPPPSSPAAAVADLGGLAVPLTIVLDGITLPLATIAGLADGSVIELGRAGASLPVRLLVGDRAIATGELIAVGEGYGVLIGARA